GIYISGTTAPWGEMLIDTVIIEEGVTSVGDYAFAYTEEVKQVSLPETLTYLGIEAFYRCGMTEVDLPDALSTIESNAFLSCDSLRRVKLPAGLRRIPMGMFQRCSALRDITLPESVETVEEYAFAGCTSLEELRIPAALTDFREYAFEYNPAVKLILAEKGGEAEAYCVRHHITYSYAENE
ncbi:MAG: leucine-rich repeat domain-containing protein, partial [Clostridia bacterium]|nr:leucine-rich repeat domain-containing protein [Clostridia bacterium]